MANILRKVWRRTKQFLGVREAPNPTAPANKPNHGLVVCMPLLAVQSKMSNQELSSFFRRLPLEIRRQIYNELLPADKQLWIRPVKASGGTYFEVPGAWKDATLDTQHFEHYPIDPAAVDAIYSRDHGCEFFAEAHPDERIDQQSLVEELGLESTAPCWRPEDSDSFWRGVDAEMRAWKMSHLHWDSMALMLSCKRM